MIPTGGPFVSRTLSKPWQICDGACVRAYTYLLVDVQLAEDLGRIQEVSVVDDSSGEAVSHAWTLVEQVGEGISRILLDIPAQKREVEDERQPVTVDEEHEGEEAMDGSLGDDVRVQAVAEIDGVDVVTAQRGSVSTMPLGIVASMT